MDQENIPLLTLLVSLRTTTRFFHVLQEILQYGRSFEVERLLSDERYQTLKVSRLKKMADFLAFSFSSVQKAVPQKPFASSTYWVCRALLIFQCHGNSSVKGPSFRCAPSWLHLFFISCQLFTSVFGVGPKTAEKWYRLGLRSFGDVMADRTIQLNRMQQNGTSVSHRFLSATPEITD